MKSFIAILAASLVAVASSNAAADTHHSLIIHGTFRTVTVSGTVNTIVKTAISNADLIKPFTSGTAPAKDFDVVIDSVTAEIDVIKKPATTSGTASVVAVIGNPAPANTVSEIHSNVPKHLGGYEVISNYAITLPSTFISQTYSPAVTGMYLTLGSSKTDSSEFAKITAASFAGGFGEGTAHAYIISGNASTTSTTYTY